MKRGADLHVPNIRALRRLRKRFSSSHSERCVGCPCGAFYSTVESLIASLPELSITAEAYFLT